MVALDNGFMYIRLVLWVTLAASTAIANAAVSLVRDYRLQPPRDRNVFFAMAVTPDRDVLSLIGNKDRFSFCVVIKLGRRKRRDSFGPSRELLQREWITFRWLQCRQIPIPAIQDLAG
jgi:hypothetical protein